MVSHNYRVSINYLDVFKDTAIWKKECLVILGQETNVFVFAPVKMRHSLIHEEGWFFRRQIPKYIWRESSVDIRSWPPTLWEVFSGILPIIQQVQYLRLEGFDTHCLSKKGWDPHCFLMCDVNSLTKLPFKDNQRLVWTQSHGWGFRGSIIAALMECNGCCHLGVLLCYRTSDIFFIGKHAVSLVSISSPFQLKFEFYTCVTSQIPFHLEVELVFGNE